MKILEEGSLPEDMRGTQHIGKKFRCPNCSTVIQLEASDIKEGQKREDIDVDRNTSCPRCHVLITFTLDELIHENVDPPSWEEIRSQMNKQLQRYNVMRVEPTTPLEQQYKQAVQSGDEEAQERIMRQVWEEKNP